MEWRCFALLIRADAASLCARSRGKPSSARCEQRLSERLTPCPCDPVCACTGMRGHAGKGNSGYRYTRKQTKGRQNDAAEEQKEPAFLSEHPHAAQRAVTGWRGGLGRVGADLASAGSMRPPPSPARTVSTAWLATTKARQETTRHANTARHATKHASRETTRHHQSQPRNATHHTHKPCSTWTWRCHQGFTPNAHHVPTPPQPAPPGQPP